MTPSRSKSTASYSSGPTDCVTRAMVGRPTSAQRLGSPLPPTGTVSVPPGISAIRGIASSIIAKVADTSSEARCASLSTQTSLTHTDRVHRLSGGPHRARSQDRLPAPRRRATGSRPGGRPSPAWPPSSRVTRIWAWPIRSLGALGRTRTYDTQLRRLVLYPLSYEGEKKGLTWGLLSAVTSRWLDRRLQHQDLTSG